MLLLAADVGGTKTAVAVAEVGPRSIALRREARYASAEYRGLEEILEDFLCGHGPAPRFAGAGVAGPVRKGRARITKLPWRLDEKSLGRRFPKTSFRLLNDFVANALGLPYLKPRQVATLARGAPERGGPIALIGAGTGLGQAGLLEVGGRYEPFASEGGHKDFSPRDEREERLRAFPAGALRACRMGQDPGGRGPRSALRLPGGGGRRAAEHRRREGSRAGAGSGRRHFAARSRRRSARARRARLLRITLRLGGGQRGASVSRDRTESSWPGESRPRSCRRSSGARFLESFRAKPPMREMLERIPVRIVLEPRLGLLGAAAAAYRMAIETTRPSSKRMLRLAMR